MQNKCFMLPYLTILTFSRSAERLDGKADLIRGLVYLKWKLLVKVPESYLRKNNILFSWKPTVGVSQTFRYANPFYLFRTLNNTEFTPDKAKIVFYSISNKKQKQEKNHLKRWKSQEDNKQCKIRGPITILRNVSILS